VTRIRTFSDALAAIWARSSYDRGFVSNPFAGDEAARLGLRRTEALLRHLDHPERSFPVVHVAGSKGKGSTCMVVDSILRAADMRTGRFLSPHLHSYRERFVVDDELIPEADFTALTAELIDAAEHVERMAPEVGEITAFELSTAMAFQWFSQSACEVAVIEVGLGGTLDATNVVDPAVSIITALDFEHTAILGTTMAEIAGNKAGIIKPGRPVVSATQPAEGIAVIEARAAEYEAPLYVAGRDWTVRGSDRDFMLDGRRGTLEHLHSALAGHHQVENAALAIAAVQVLRDIHGAFSSIDERAIRQGVATTRHPGRFEQVALPSGQTVVIDGAHSPASAKALAATVEDRFPGASVAIVIGMLTDKEPTQILDPLRDCADHWIAVAPDSPRALPVDALRSAVEAMGARCAAAPGVAEGIQEATALGCEVVLVTGSLTTAAEARTALGLAPPPDDLD
jgi:dihydrofolate synthase/folylpolyglutamate synthase